MTVIVKVIKLYVKPAWALINNCTVKGNNIIVT